LILKDQDRDLKHLIHNASTTVHRVVMGRLQCTYSYESSAYAWKLTPCWSILSARSDKKY